MARLFATIAALLVLVGAPTVAAARPSQTGPALDATAQLELVEQTFGVEADGTITMRYRLSGIADDALQFLPPPEPVLQPVPDPAPSDTIPPDTATADTAPTDTGGSTIPGEPVVEAEPLVQLTLEVTNYEPVTDVDELDDVIGNDVDPDAFSGVIDGVAITDVRRLATVDDDGSVTLDIEVGTDMSPSVEDRLELDRPGVYPLRIQLLVGDPDDDVVVATAGTVVQRLPGPGDVSGRVVPPIDLSVITVTPAPSANATTQEVAAAERMLDDAIDLAAGLTAPVTLEVPPRLVADATSTPADAERIAEALAGDELVALPIVPLDVSSAVAVGREDSFARLLNAGQDLLTASVPTTPSRRDVWIAPERLSSGGAQELRDLGVRFIVMPQAIYRSSVDSSAPPADLFVEATLPDGGDLPVLVVGPIADALTPAAANDILDDATATEWAVSTLAALVVAQAEADLQETGSSNAPERSVVLTTPTLLPPDLRLLSAFETLVATTSSARFTPASALIGVTDVQLDNDAQPVTVQLPESAGPSLAQRVDRIDNTALIMVSAASMLPDDDQRLAEWTEELDSLISTGYSDPEVEAATAELIAEATAITSAVVLPEPFTFTLTGRSGPIEIRMGNTSAEPLDVLLQLRSSKVEFPDGDQVVTLRPNDETSVIVPVEARSNGTSSIELLVSTPAGETLGEPVNLTSRVTGFTGLGQLLMGGFIIVVVTWWFTHWRSRRRRELALDSRDRHPTGAT